MKKHTKMLAVVVVLALVLTMAPFSALAQTEEPPAPQEKEATAELAPPTGEQGAQEMGGATPPICSCAALCKEGSINTVCAVCLAEFVACAAAAEEEKEAASAPLMMIDAPKNDAEVIAVEYGTPKEDIVFPALWANGEPVDGAVWHCETYNGNTVGNYVFTAAIPEGYTLEEGSAAIEAAVRVSGPTFAVQSEVQPMAGDDVFMVDGIFYKVLSENAPGSAGTAGQNTVEVTADGDVNKSYAGATLTIPPTVTGNVASANTIYEVVGIAGGAFTSNNNIITVDLSGTSLSIGNEAFQTCNKLESVDLGNATSIGGGAFFACGSLASVTFPKTPYVIEFGPNQGAFTSCAALRSVDLGGVTKIGISTFYSCDRLETVNFGTSITEIGNYAFSMCSNLTSITIPDSVTALGEGVFAECKKLITVDLNKNIKTIENSTFRDCTLLETIDLRNIETIGSRAFVSCDALKNIDLSNVEMIESEAFLLCSALEKVDIGGNCNTIETSAFNNCIGIKEVWFRGDAPSTIVNDAFGSISNVSSRTLYYPAGKEAQYNPATFANGQISNWTFQAFVDAQTPSITGQPKGGTYIAGATPAPLTIAASITDGGTPSYQWYSNTANNTTGGTPLSGATSASYAPPAGMVGTTYYYCIITNTNSNVLGNKTATTTSGAAAITFTRAQPVISGSNALAGTIGAIGNQTVTVNIAGSYPEAISLIATLGDIQKTAICTGDGTATFVFAEAELNNLPAGDYNITVSSAQTANNNAARAAVVGTITVSEKQSVLLLSGLPKNSTMYVGESITLSPQGAADTNTGSAGWSFDGAFFKATFNSPATFTAIKAGTTTITYAASDGQTAGATITILEKADTAAQTVATTTTRSPKTGDASNLGLWIALCAVAGTGIVCAAAFGRKRARRKENK